MEIVKAELTDVERLAELNRCLIEDEQHPNPMNIAELTERMKAWLATDYICYLVKESGHIIAYCLYRDDGGHYYCYVTLKLMDTKIASTACFY